MSAQMIFRRYELKYLLTQEQKKIILEAMAPYMKPDRYGKTVIRNLYLDTPDYRLIRRSMEKPAYKEKLRIRSYSRATPDGMVYVELKKKYDGLVYKRRIALPYDDAMDWLGQKRFCPIDTQISREINAFTEFYQHPEPKVFLSYQREAYYHIDGGGFRVTFDDHIQSRTDDLNLCAPVSGDLILPTDKVLMEIKCTGGIPMWMVQILSRERIYKTSFSKYGTAYSLLIFPEMSGRLSQQKEHMIYGSNF